MSVICNHADLLLSLQAGPLLHISFRSDLPAGSLAIMDACRLYADEYGVAARWNIFNKKVTIVKVGDAFGFNISIDVIAGDKMNQDLFWRDKPGIALPNISEQVFCEVTIGARQDVPSFGKDNMNLRGAAVDDYGGVNIVRVRRAMYIPIG